MKFLETIPEEGEGVSRGRSRSNRRYTDTIPTQDVEANPLIDLASYGRDLELETKVHRMDRSRFHRNADFGVFPACDSIARATTDVGMTAENSCFDAGCKTSDVPAVEIIVVESEDDNLAYSQTQNKSLHQLLDEEKWDEAQTDLETFRTQPGKVLPDSTLLSDVSGSSALHIAAYTAPNHITLQLLEVLIQNPAPDCKPLERARALALCGDKEGNTPLHLACARLNIDEKGNFDFVVVKHLVDLARTAVRSINNDGNTPINLLLSSKAYIGGAGRGKNTESAVAALLDAASDASMIQNNRGLTPLHTAIFNHCSERVLYKLISYGIAAFDKADGNGLKPIHYTSLYGAPLSCLELMVESTPESICSVTSSQGETPLHYTIANLSKLAQYGAVSTGNSESYISQVLTILTGNDCHETSPLWMTNDDGYTPLHFCAIHNTPSENVEDMLKAVNGYTSSVALTTPNNQGATPLHIAVDQLSIRRPRHKSLTREQRTNLERLVSLFATPLTCNVVDKNGRTPLILAVQRGHPSLAAIYFLLKANPKSSTLPDDFGRLPLHYACRHRHVDEKVVRGEWAG